MKIGLQKEFLTACLTIALALWGFSARAQSPSGALTGTVLDPAGAVIPGANVVLEHPDSGFKRTAITDARGEFHFETLPPGEYRLRVDATGFAERSIAVTVSVSSRPTVSVVMGLKKVEETVVVDDRPSLTDQPMETNSSIEKTIIGDRDLEEIPLAHRSFANIAYLAPMTAPVEPSDPTKARITAVSFAGSSGLNVDLSVDGGDNNDDFIGGFLQNYSPDAIQEFAVRTSQFDADTSRTNGGSVVISTRAGTNTWHGGLEGFFRGRALNARNNLDNPEPNPKQPFSRYNGVASLGGPLIKNKLFLFTSLEYVDENASVAYSSQSLGEFQALSQLASSGVLPGGIASIGSVPTSVLVPFRDTLFSSRLDWEQSQKSRWFLRAALDRNHTRNDLIQQATLPSTGAFTRSNYFSVLADETYTFGPRWMGEFIAQASGFHHTKERNSNLGLALAFPFSTNFHTTSGFETFGDNEFVTGITAFPIARDQQKYQLRYDVSTYAGPHAVKFGVNFIHEPVLRGALPGNAEQLFVFGHDPSFYVANPGAPLDVNETDIPAQEGVFAQSVRRFGIYAQDSWRARPSFTVNFGVRYDTTFGLFRASGRMQDQNPAVLALSALGIPLAPGVPHDYRSAIAPRVGIAYAPGNHGSTVFRAGVGIYYNDLAQNGWVDAFRAVNNGSVGTALGPGDQGAIIDPNYHSPYALQASAGAEHQFGSDWRVNVHFEHQQGVHQYRRYEYVSDATLPAAAPSISLFRTDNRSRYDGVSFQVTHSFTSHFELNAHYTLSSASTWGATVGELFDYVNGVTDVRNPFGPGDHGPSGEDIRHRFVFSAVWHAPGKIEFATLSQWESARPFTIATPEDLNGDGLSSNDRAVVNGVATSLDQFRGTPVYQTDLRVSREFKLRERFTVRPFVEFFNLFNRSNPGNNFVGDISALPTPVNDLTNATAFCLNTACTQTQTITSLRQLRVPAGALGDFFGPGTTVGIPFSAQFGLRLSF